MTLYANGIKVAPTIKVGSNDRYLVEASDPSLMPSWYRVYSDGWVEQGGYVYDTKEEVDIEFIKHFANTNYFISVTAREVQNRAVPDFFCAENISETSMTIWSYYANEPGVGWVSALWEAKGFIGEEEE